MVSSIISRTQQSAFLNIPQSPICYWLRRSFFDLMSETTLGSISNIVQQVITANNQRFLRYYWEEKASTKRWINYLKAGGYRKWSGYEQILVDWRESGNSVKTAILEKYPYLKGNWGWLIKENTIFLEGWTYTLMARGCLSTRKLEPGFICDSVSPTIVFNNNFEGIGAILNSRVTSYLLRSITAEIKFRENYIARIPLPRIIPQVLFVLETNCIVLKRLLVSSDLTESSFSIKFAGLVSNDHLIQHLLAAVLHTLEGLGEQLVFDAYRLDKEDIAAVLAETGTPAGWYPLIHGYEAIPSLPDDLQRLPDEVVALLAGCERRACSEAELGQIRDKLRSLYEAGTGAKEESNWSESGDYREEGEEEAVAGARIPIPTETFLEELSQKMKIHPISIYWLLKEGIEEQGWRCLSEEKRIPEDRFTVMVLQLLGHRWPVQIERGEPVPEWADHDGIIPLTEGCGEKTLFERIRERIVYEFHAETVTQSERKFAEVVGKSLDAWLSGDFFKRHISHFRKRPIAWQIQSKPLSKWLKGQKKSPAFSCLIYYHKLDADLIHKIRSQYVRPLMTRYETEFRTLQGSNSESNDVVVRKYQLENWIEELRSFDEELERLTQDGFNTEKLSKTIREEPLDKWSSLDGQKSPPGDTDSFYNQEKAYFPDINDGVRVNIAPLQQAGLLVLNVLAQKDVVKAIENRTEWRADERRWCREGKLTKPGWWD